MATAQSANSLLSTLDEQRKKLETRSLDISFNELVDMVASKELDIQPDFQRLFQWSEGAQSRFIESLLLEMPIPPIYVVETEENRYVLIDGLQRISSYLHFRGALDAPTRDIAPGVHLVLSDCDIVPEFNGLQFSDLPTTLQIRLKRYFVRVQVIRHGSDPHYKYFMFKRLNTGGVNLSEQQLRNCTIRLLSSTFNDFISRLNDDASYRLTISNLTDEQVDQWYDQELVLRFFALKNWREGFVHNVGDYLTEYLERVSDNAHPKHVAFDYATEEQIFRTTFKLLAEAFGDKAFSRSNKANTDFVEAFGVYHFEAIAIATQSIISDAALLPQVTVPKLRENLRSIKLDPGFTAITKGGGKNSKGALEARIAFVEGRLRGAFQP
ncbi:MAG: DUF262 domain-containing protein [Polaromonas sp.]|nr:DUF262 domain-containing protein [Polaromonas sp.]